MQHTGRLHKACSAEALLMHCCALTGGHALLEKSAALTWAALEEDQTGIPLLAVDQLLCRQRLARGVSGRQRHELVHLALAQAVC